jgi:hypothetical protein
MTPMKDYKNILASFIEVVVFLFASFGGFLSKIAPPDEASPSYYVGIVSFLVLAILLIVSGVSRRAPGQRHRWAWMSAGIVCLVLAVPSALIYPRMLRKYTYPFPLERPTEVRVNGSAGGLTEVAKEWVKENPLESSPAVLARKFPLGQVWTQESIEHARMILLVSYGALVLSLATAIFCLVEADTNGASRAGK